MANKTQFEIFLETNVNEYTEKKNGQLAFHYGQ